MIAELAKFGLVLSNSAAATGTISPDELLVLAEFADYDRRWSTVWVGDSFLTAARLEAIVALSACAARTKRVALGIGCLATMGLRGAVELTIQLASLDLMSRGRLLLAACAGPPAGAAAEQELALFGLTYSQKADRMEQMVRAVRRASETQKLTVDTRAGDNGEVEFSPAFMQRPLPIWMVANPPAGVGARREQRLLKRVAELGDGWMTFGSAPEVIADRVTVLREMRRDAGKGDQSDAFPICAYIDVNVDEDAGRAISDAVETSKQEGRRNATPEQIRQAAAVGTADEVVPKLEALIRAGVTDLAIRPLTQAPREQVERISSRILPALQARHEQA